MSRLRPIHGWRAFWGEVGIVVLGVLLALGAQQAVETWSWRGQVRDFRAAADLELSENLALWQYRLRQDACVKRRLAELDRLLATPEGAAPPRRVQPIGRVPNYVYGLGVWENKDDAVTAHLPGDLRTRYALIYEEFENDEAKRLRENETWEQIGQFDLPEPLSHEDRLRLTELVGRARRVADSRRRDYDEAMVHWVKDLGIRAQKPVFLVEKPSDFCRPFLAPA